MVLQDILDQLSVGELSQIALTETVNGELPEKSKKDLVTHINMGLTALHKRFILNRETIRIALQPDLLTYIIDRKYAESNMASNETKYIMDAAAPYSGRLMQIEAVSDDLGDMVPLNIGNRRDSLKTPNFKTLVLPPRSTATSNLPHLLDRTTFLDVTIRANHRTLRELDLIYPANMVEIDLPETHLEPLLYYIASRVLNPVGMSQEFHEGNNYAAKYEASCLQIQNEGYELSDPGLVNTFARDGWV